jgi:cobalt/nickel transport system ATP-binding protein
MYEANDNAAIEVEELHYTYPDGTQALRGVTFFALRGEKVALIGPNGAGKSTLLLHLNGLLPASPSGRRGEGIVKIWGERVSGETIREVRRRVGMVFQDPDNQLFCPTIFEDVAFGPVNLGLPGDKVRQRVERALQEVGLQGLEKHSCFHISFGEKKRVSIATILALEPEIMVFDEPSSNLDPRRRRDLIRFLQRWTRTLIVASHDLDLVLDVCSKVYLMNRGEIVAAGDAAEILRNRALLEANDLELPLRLQAGTHERL